MAANIMQNWGQLAPRRDFFESFIDPLLMGQELAAKRLVNQEAKTRNQYLGPDLEAALLGKQLLNESRQMENQMTKEVMPFNLPMAEQEMMEAILGNQNAQLDLQLKPQEFQMKQEQMAIANAVKNMQMQKYAAEIEQLRNPTMPNMFEGPASVQEIAWLNKLKESGDVESAELLEKKILGRSGFGSAPADFQRAQIAQAAGFGLDFAEATQRLQAGETLEQIAQAQGIPPEEMYNYQPIYPPTTAVLTQTQKRQGAEAELDSLTEQYAKMIDAYADTRTIGGYSPSQVMDAISSEPNVDKQSDFIVATMLYPEITYNRLRLAAAETGISSLMHMEETAADKFNAFVPLFKNRELKQAVIHKMNKALGSAANFANSSIVNPIGAANKKREQQIKSEAEHTIKEEKSNQKTFESLTPEQLENMSIEELEALG